MIRKQQLSLIKCCKIIPNSKVIVKRILDPDDNLGWTSKNKLVENNISHNCLELVRKVFSEGWHVNSLHIFWLLEMPWWKRNISKKCSVEIHDSIGIKNPYSISFRILSLLMLLLNCQTLHVLLVNDFVFLISCLILTCLMSVF